MARTCGVRGRALVSRRQKRKFTRGRRYRGPGVGPQQPSGAPVVDVKWLQRSEEERKETLDLGNTGRPVRHGLTDAERRAIEMVRRVQGELPPW